MLFSAYQILFFLSYMPYNGNEESDFCGYQYYIEILANFTKKHNYTQDALAKKLNMSRQAISKWETGVSHG